MDTFMETYLKEKGQAQNVIPRDKSLARMGKIREIYGPISRMGELFEEARSSSQGGQTEIDINVAASQMEQVVTLVGQAINSTTFLRRKATLTALKGSETLPLQWLRETYSKELKENNDSLFGQKFVDKMKKDAGTHNKTVKQLLSGGSYSNRPFQGGSSSKASSSGGQH